MTGNSANGDSNSGAGPSKRHKSSQTKKTPVVSESRRLAQASRTLTACELCRKQKVRCFRTPDNPNTCLRCAILNRVCSFEGEGGNLVEKGIDKFTDGKKIDMIYDGITDILNILKSGAVNKLPESTVNKPPHPKYQEDTLEIKMAPSESLIVSPFAIIHKENNQIIPNVIQNLLGSPKTANASHYDDVVSNGILSLAQVYELMASFRQNFGRWVLFPSSLSTETLVDRIRNNSSFLLTTCCCLSLRFSANGTFDNLETLLRARNTMKLIKQKLLKDLDKTITKSTSTFSGQVEFLQALVILSIYLYSLTSIFANLDGNEVDIDPEEKFSLDPWLLSSIGLTAFVSKSVFGNLFKSNIEDDVPTSALSILYSELDSKEYQTLTYLRIYNHLCLVHLVNCVFTGRMCIIDEIRLNYCTAALSLPSATNFDGRMVSEIEILLITYNYIQVNLNVFNNSTPEEALESVIEEFAYWHQQWEYIFNQPALQFVELCYHFCYLLVYFTYNYHKIKQGSTTRTSPIYEEENIQFVIEKCHTSSLIKMIQYSYLVIKKVNHVGSDAYFAYLSDQIHVVFFFGGLMLTKILYQLTKDGNLQLLNTVVVPELGKLSLKTMIDDLNRLIDMFSRVGQGNPDDIMTKYSDGLRKAMVEAGLSHG